MSAENVRKDSLALAELDRHSPLFVALRDSAQSEAQVRCLRIPRDLRRVKSAELCVDRRYVRRGAVLRVRAEKAGISRQQSAVSRQQSDRGGWQLALGIWHLAQLSLGTRRQMIAPPFRAGWACYEAPSPAGTASVVRRDRLRLQERSPAKRDVEHDSPGRSRRRVLGNVAK